MLGQTLPALALQTQNNRYGGGLIEPTASRYQNLLPGNHLLSQKIKKINPKALMTSVKADSLKIRVLNKTNPASS